MRCDNTDEPKIFYFAMIVYARAMVIYVIHASWFMRMTAHDILMPKHTTYCTNNFEMHFPQTTNLYSNQKAIHVCS